MTPDSITNITHAAFACAGFILGVLTMTILISGQRPTEGDDWHE